MSDKKPDDIDNRRLDYDGPERFSDRCANCGHTRADHLPKGIRTPVAGSICTVMICKSEIPHKHSKRVCVSEQCSCMWEAKA